MTLPTIFPRIKGFGLEMVTNATVTQSPYSFDQTSYNFMGGMWRATLELYGSEAAHREAFLGWLAGLEGPAQTFQLPAFHYEGPFGTLTQNPVIATAAKVRAKSIVVTRPAAQELAVGDLITIGTHLHRVTKDKGNVGVDQGIEIWPRLRADVAAGDAIEALAPTGSWRLAGNVAGYKIANKIQFSMSLKLVEAL